MKKSITAGLALLWVCMMILGGCSSKTQIFSLENSQKVTVTSISGEKIEVADEDMIRQITENITSIQFERGESSKNTNGFGPMVSWYDSSGNVIETISVMSEDTIIYNNYFWTAVNGSIDTEVINAVLSSDASSLDGVSDDAAISSGTQEQAGEEDWEDKALLEEYETYGIEKEDNLYYYKGELVYIIKDQHPDSSVYLFNTDSKGTVSIKLIRNAEEEITSVTYMTEEEVAKALPRILGGASSLDGVTMEAAEYSDTNAEEFKEVLLGDSPFIYCSGGNAEAMVITDAPALFDEYDPLMKIWEFSVVDLNGDGEDEVILFVVGVAGDMGGKVILHQIGDKVYGYTTDNRTLVDLKMDGSYSYSDPTGVTEVGIAAIVDFSEDEYTIDKITYATGTYKGWDSFVAEHQSVTEEDYLDAVSRQDQKQNAEWYEFSDENIVRTVEMSDK